MISPFMNHEEYEKIKKERDSLINIIVNNVNINKDEARFITRRINIITEKLLEKAKYSGKIK